MPLENLRIVLIEGFHVIAGELGIAGQASIFSGAADVFLGAVSGLILRTAVVREGAEDLIPVPVDIRAVAGVVGRTFVATAHADAPAGGVVEKTGASIVDIAIGAGIDPSRLVAGCGYV